MARVILVGFSELTARLPEALAGHGLELVAVGSAASPFRRSRFIDRFVSLRGDGSTESWITTLLEDPSLAAGPDDWVFHAEDRLPRAIARLEVPVERRLALLPIRRASGLAMVGSKAGLADLLTRHGIATPASVVVATPQALPAALSAALSAASGPLMLKGDHGGGGTEVRRCGDAAEVLADPPPPHWYPLVLQRWVEGEDVSIEALFCGGELVGLQTSILLACCDRHGPSLSRRFLPSAPDGAIPILQELGREAGLHGLFNCTLRQPVTAGADGGMPLLFEADPRPNAWCAYGPRLGLDWGALMVAACPPPTPRQSQVLPPGGQVVHLFPRGPEQALRTGSWSLARPWLLARPGTWELRPRRDAAVGAWEWRQLRRAITPRLLARPLGRLAQALPGPLRRWALERGLDRRLLRRLGV